jgi:hypothetical protein
MKSKFFLLFSFVLIHFAKAQLSGNYTINSAQATGGTNFQSFSDFAASINLNGVSGNVITTVTPGSGPYTEQVVFDNISGTGPSATIMLEGSGETITALTDSANRHVVRLKDVQYFTINNLRINRNVAAASGFYGIHILNTGNNITISNCYADMSGSNSTLIGGFVASGSLTSILVTGDFHNLSFLNDSTRGGGYGVSVFGLASPLASGILIDENTFNDFHSNGVYLRETDGTIVRNNHFDKSTANITSVNAIQVAQSANINASIYNNFIKVSQTNNGSVTFRGIYLFNGTGHKVYNNVIHDINLVSGNFTGIEVRTASTSPEIYFNTISIDNPSASSGNLYGIKEELSNTNSILRNNIISISQTTSATKAGIALGNLSPLNSVNSNYNNIWVPGGNVAMRGGTTPTYYATLANWQAASTRDSNSISLDPMFLSVAMPQPTNFATDNAATPIAWITTDVTGLMRNAVTPDVGAYEFPSNVGTGEEIISSSAKIFPVPFSNSLNVSVMNNEQAEITLYGTLGQKVVTQKFVSSSSINTSRLPAGVYFYELRNEKSVIRKGKVIKD